MKWLINLFKIWFEKKEKHKEIIAPPSLPSESVEGTDYTLLKPVTTRNGHAGVIVQCSVRVIAKVEINGHEDVQEYRVGYANGNRSHVFLNRTGADYPPNSIVRVWGDGKILEGIWEDPNYRKTLILTEVPK